MWYAISTVPYTNYQGVRYLVHWANTTVAESTWEVADDIPEAIFQSWEQSKMPSTFYEVCCIAVIGARCLGACCLTLRLHITDKATVACPSQSVRWRMGR